MNPARILLREWLWGYWENKRPGIFPGSFGIAGWVSSCNNCGDKVCLEFFGGAKTFISNCDFNARLLRTISLGDLA